MDIELQSHLLLFIYFYFFQQSYSLCFHGTCGFPCHCKNRTLCADENSARDCDCVETPVQPWSGPGCQIGNIVTHRKTRLSGGSSWTITYDEECTDEILAEDNFCIIKRSGELLIRLETDYIVSKVIVYNVTTPLNVSLSWPDVEEYRTQTIRGNQEVILPRIKTFSVAIKNFSNKDLKIGEVVVQGYVHKVCQSLNSSYFHGPGCLRSCGCLKQCDYINGECSIKRTDL